jgi:hypothetical protein
MSSFAQILGEKYSFHLRFENLIQLDCDVFAMDVESVDVRHSDWYGLLLSDAYELQSESLSSCTTLLSYLLLRELGEDSWDSKHLFRAFRDFVWPTVKSNLSTGALAGCQLDASIWCFQSAIQCVKRWDLNDAENLEIYRSLTEWVTILEEFLGSSVKADAMN